MFIDTLGYETDTYYLQNLYGEALSELQGELGTELGFFKSIKKFFKKAWKGVKKVFKKPLKIVKRAWRGIKKFIRRNKRTLATIGLVAASTALPILKPIAYPLAMQQAQNIVGRYIYGKPKVQYEEIPQVQYQYETPQLQPSPITPIDATMSQAQAPYIQPYPYAYQGYEKPSLGKALLPLGMFLAGLFLLNK